MYKKKMYKENLSLSKILFFKELFIQSKTNSFFVVILSMLSALLNSTLAISLFPLLRELNIDKSETNKILILYDYSLSFLGISNSIYIILFFMVLVLLLNSLILIINDYFISSFTTKINKNIKVKYFTQVLKSNWSLFLDKKPGEIVNSIFLETDKSITAYRDLLELITFIIQLLFYISLSIYISLIVSFYSVVVGLIIISIFYSWNSKARIAGEKFNNSNKYIASKVLDSIKNIKTVKAMDGIKNLIGIFKDDFNELRANNYKMDIVLSIPKRMADPLMALFLSIGIIMIYTYGFIPIASILPLIFLYFRSISMFTNIQSKFQSIKKMEPFYISYKNNLNSVTINEEKNPGKINFEFKNQIKVKNLNFSYGSKQIFKNLNTRILCNKINLILSPSGYGKTTFVDILVKLLEYQNGEIFVDDVNLKNINTSSLRKNIGYVTQETFFFNDTIRNNIILNDESVNKDMLSRALKISCCNEFINQIEEGINYNIGENGSKLSGGQKQRLSIARALVKKPKILFLDESTVSLNLKIKETLINNLVQESKNGLTIIINSHEEVLKKYAENIIELNRENSNL